MDHVPLDAAAALLGLRVADLEKALLEKVIKVDSRCWSRWIVDAVLIKRLSQRFLRRLDWPQAFPQRVERAKLFAAWCSSLRRTCEIPRLSRAPP